MGAQGLGLAQIGGLAARNQALVQLQRLVQLAVLEQHKGGRALNVFLLLLAEPLFHVAQRFHAVGPRSFAETGQLAGGPL